MQHADVPFNENKHLGDDIRQTKAAAAVTVEVPLNAFSPLSSCINTADGPLLSFAQRVYCKTNPTNFESFPCYHKERARLDFSEWFPSGM